MASDNSDHFNRRSLLKGGAKAAATAALGQASPAANSLETGQLLWALKDAITAITDQEKLIKKSNFPAILAPGANIHQAAMSDPNCARQQLDQLMDEIDASRALLPQLTNAIGNGIAVAYEPNDPLFDAIDNNGILRPELLQKLVINLRTQALKTYDELKPALSQINSKTEKQYRAYQTLRKVIREVYPEREEKHIEGDARHLAYENKNWAEEYHDPEAAKQAFSQLQARTAQAIAELSKDFHESQRQAALRARNLVERLIGKKTELKDGELHVSIAASSIQAAYKALQAVLTLRDTVPLDNKTPFPPLEQLLVATQLEQNGLITDAPLDIRVPPAAYVIRLSKPMVKRLEDIEKGKAPFIQPDVSLFAQDKSAAYYQAQAQQRLALAEDLTRLKTLMNGK